MKNRCFGSLTICLSVVWVFFAGQMAFGQTALDHAEIAAGMERSAGQVASVFEQQPEWLEWIASKSGPMGKSKSASGSWGSWWGGMTKPRGRVPVSSYRRDNKTFSQRMWVSTKRAWNTTASWLDPYPDPKPESPMRPAKKSWFSGWGESWGGSSKKPSQSVSDFIGQEHPK
jgi:hypothetical protein